MVPSAFLRPILSQGEPILSQGEKGALNTSLVVR